MVGKVKRMLLKYECPSCGSIIPMWRIIQIDEYLEVIKILQPKRCVCGRTKGFNLIDMEVTDDK